MAPAHPISYATRNVTCCRCGTAFDCKPGGDCWCAAEPYRLPMPDTAADDCLCPDCLRAAAPGTPSVVTTRGSR